MTCSCVYLLSLLHWLVFFNVSVHAQIVQTINLLWLNVNLLLFVGVLFDQFWGG